MKNHNRGIFITIEGIEGVGKSTALQFLSQYLTKKNITCLITREPGGTPIAEDIRKILLSHYEESMLSDTELLLFFAGRIQHISQVIKPALQNGTWVISDRFTDASFAYQGGGRGVPFSRIAAIAEWALGDFIPDITLLLDTPVEVSLQRLQERMKKDRFEEEDVNFFNRIRAAYLKLAKQQPARFRIINADVSLAEVEQQMSQVIDSL